MAVSTPWRDVYWSSRDSLRRAVHAHVWTGGAEAWVWASPMDGSRPGLGLTLTEGALWAYSVESREPFTGSNVRGHLYLHVTDHARAPHAMGGQPAISLPAGENYRWAWRLAWYADLPDLHADRAVSLDAERLATETGGSISVTMPRGLVAERAAAGAEHLPRHSLSRRDRRHRCGPDRPACSTCRSSELAERRARFVLDASARSGTPGQEQAAFVPYDNESGLTVLPGGWADWSEVRERVGTALCCSSSGGVAGATRSSWTEALAAYQAFVRRTDRGPTDGTVRDDIHRPGPARLYNFPWFARFLLDQGEVELAASIMDRYYANGGDHFLAFELGPVMTELAECRAADGRGAEAAALRDQLLSHAQRFLDYGDDLPAHEVNYEQSMVAPLLELLLAARGSHRRGAGPELAAPAALADRLRCRPTRRPRCGTCRSDTGTATGSAGCGCGVTSSRTTGPCSAPAST